VSARFRDTQVPKKSKNDLGSIFPNWLNEAFHFGFGARYGSLPETLKNLLRLGDEVTALGEYKGTIDLGAGITASIDIKAEGN